MGPGKREGRDSGEVTAQRKLNVHLELRPGPFIAESEIEADPHRTLRLEGPMREREGPAG